MKELVPGTFDVITLWHVMEHLEHLDETWELLRELLTEKGVLIVAVPNCSSYDAMNTGSTGLLMMYPVIYGILRLPRFSSSGRSTDLSGSPSSDAFDAFLCIDADGET